MKKSNDGPLESIINKMDKTDPILFKTKNEFLFKNADLLLNYYKKELDMNNSKILSNLYSPLKEKDLYKKFIRRNTEKNYFINTSRLSLLSYYKKSETLSSQKKTKYNTTTFKNKLNKLNTINNEFK